MTQDTDLVEDAARRRLRSLRHAPGLVARRAGPPVPHQRVDHQPHRDRATAAWRSTSWSSLARALDTTVDELLAEADDDDVVIRPTRDVVRGVTNWTLSRPDDPSGRIVAKMRMPAAKRRPDPRVHPGRDWFYVLDGTARLLLGEREHLVEAGQAAEFDTHDPHWITGYGGPVELLTIFDRHGEQAHLRND